MKVLGIPRSNYYRFISLRFFLPGKRRGRKERVYSITVYGEKVSDLRLKGLLYTLSSFGDPMEPRYYLKTLGSKKLSRYIRRNYGIIVNHKKLHKLRKELGLINTYNRKRKAVRRYSRAMKVERNNTLWEADIKFIKTDEGNVALLDTIDVYDKTIVGSYFGKGCKSDDFMDVIQSAIISRKEKPTAIRTDNGSQFTALSTGVFMEGLGIEQEFGLKHNPDSQAHIESHHSTIQREFVLFNTFRNASEVYEKYLVYMDFYHNYRPHGSLGYLTPSEYNAKPQKTEVLLVKS